MYEILKKRNIFIFSIVFILFITFAFSYYIQHETKENQLLVEIYSIECCPLCVQAKKSLPNKLKEKFGSRINVEIINVDEKDNEKKYEELVSSISNFNDDHRNRFPLINVDNFFVVIGYNYYYDSEIINDIIRMKDGNHLGKRLENSRYVRRV